MRKIYFFLILLTATTFVSSSSTAFAQRAYRATDRQIADLLRQTERDSDVFSRDLMVALDRSSYNGTRTEDEITNYVRDFEEATDRLKERFEGNLSVAADVEEVLNRAGNIDNFLRQNRFETSVSTNWNRVRSDLNTLARYYDVSWNWNRTNYPSYGNNQTGGTRVPYRASDAQVSASLQTLERDSDYFSRSLETALDRSRLNGTQYEDEVRNYVREFEEATDRLKERFDARQSVGADVEEVLFRANNIDRFLTQNRLNARVTSDWTRVRTSLNTLANYYGVTWNRNRYPTSGGFPTGGTTTTTGRLNGTYRLDTTRSVNVEAEIDRAIGDLDVNRRERIRRNALRRLEAPEYFAIERSGNNVTIGSSKSRQVTFLADGRPQTETTPNGRSMSVTASFVGNQLTINYSGDRMNDYYVAFNPARGGNELRVTRRIYLEGVARQITVDSVYTKTSDIAQFDTIYNNSTTGGVYNNTQNGDFVIANGTRLVAVLGSNLDTKTAQVGDRFTMEVTSPSEYNGAVIEGRVASVERSGRVSGRAGIGLDFDTIRLRDGRSYRFAGLVEQVRTANNENVGITNEGEVREGNNQTTRTVTRTAIGAALGALIGAIAGGGQGAAVGAAVGAGAGAGSVILQGRDDLELSAGTEVTITASAPRVATVR